MPRLKRVVPFIDPGYTRIRVGKDFRFVTPRGRDASKKDTERIRALVIPPAWTEVWISAHADGHIQVVGTDAAGRKQYLYHPRWSASRDKGKFARALALADALPRARARVTQDLRQDGLSRQRVLAVAFRMLDQAAPRVGSTVYLKANGSRGLSTLQRRDASVEGSVVTLSFPAKSGKRALLRIDDADLATAIGELAAGRPGAPLLSPRRGRKRVSLSAGDINEYLRAVTGGRFTAKDFRTLRGTVLAAETLARIGSVETKKDRARAEALAVAATAEGLGNTPAVARGSYIDPRVFQRYREGRVLSLEGSRDKAIRALLG
ncbi:DNA topoisomerase IB [Microbacterium rhizomatis]|uniref:DNA topoisomerase IB n=1 Tax=Microbacterium rhizomatis TaxID=1631477 RepID=A0A5J5J1J3_9MICO|nr:DNA topoisomerase IB [Microbacterium rhizomatis]KAA9106430.1 DNA topoisomerase IB [Microbacterium rhizomatis]